MEYNRGKKLNTTRETKSFTLTCLENTLGNDPENIKSSLWHQGTCGQHEDCIENDEEWLLHHFFQEEL